ncbi:MAG: hypothetical protein ACRDFX_08585 [Chloroflexota bacterium]
MAESDKENNWQRASVIGRYHGGRSDVSANHDEYLNEAYDSPNWLDACMNMLSVFLEDLDTGRDHPERSLPGIGPSIVDQVAAVADRARLLQLRYRATTEERGPEFQTSELGAMLWWAGMGSHQAAEAVTISRDMMAGEDWERAFIQINALLYDTISALSILSTAEGMMKRDYEGRGRERPN